MFENLVINVTPKDIENLIREKVKQLYPRQDVASIKFDIGTEYTGMGAGERASPVFEGVTMKLKTIPTKSDMGDR